MLEVKETKKVTLTTDKGETLVEGMRIVFRDKSGRDTVAEFRSYEKGLICLENLTNSEQYNVRASSMEYVEVLKLDGDESVPVSKIDKKKEILRNKGEL